MAGEATRPVAKKKARDIGDVAVERLFVMLKDEVYLVPVSGELKRSHPSIEFLMGIVKQPFTGFATSQELDKYLYEMTKDTVTKFLAKIYESKPEGSTTNRTALVFDTLDIYGTKLKGARALLDNNKYKSEFVGSVLFKGVWKDIIDASQILTIPLLDPMREFVQLNGDSSKTAMDGMLRA